MEKISVAVRFRPSVAADPAAGCYWRIDDQRISLHRGSPLGTPVAGVSFAFDHVFDQSSTNATVYDLLIKSIIRAAVDGFNGTAFAYGQTSSGKTFTMNGSDEDPGIIPLAVKDVFQCTKMMEDREFLIRVSYMEIYNEEINDLLSLGNQKLPIHENLERGIYVAGIREEIVNSEDQVLDLLKLGETNRHFGETNMNARSSRSHTIFRMVIESSVKDFMNSGVASNEDAIRVSVLNLVDLAGSERIAKTGADGVRLKEGKHINKSLMILGNVINKLSENGKHRGHIPYRDSKLTRILQPALGGNAKTSIICTAAPEEIHIEETRGTLQFASRAKRITNYAQVNEILTDAALLKRQKLEIEELRRKLQGSHSEVLEQIILKQRNDMHKSELECERLAMELEEERKSREALEKCVNEQLKNIEDLRNRSVSSHQTAASSQSKNDLEFTFSEASISQSEVFRTPDFNASANNFVVRRKNSLREPDWSPIPENFDNVADEDLWMKLNKGFTTNLDMLQMTPVMKCQTLSSSEIHEPTVDEEASVALEAECSIDKNLLELSEGRCVALEKECSLLREENASLTHTLLMSKRENELLTSQKEQLQKELNDENRKMKELKEDIHLFSLAFSRREGLLTSLYSKSKAMVENLKAFQVPEPEVCDC